MAVFWLSARVREGVAWLNGRLRSHYLKQVAQEIAGEVIGIGGIENRIEVIVEARRPCDAPERIAD